MCDSVEEEFVLLGEELEWLDGLGFLLCRSGGSTLVLTRVCMLIYSGEYYEIEVIVYD